MEKRPKGGTFKNLRGVYFLRLAESLYIGQSSEFGTRLGHHGKKEASWWCFIALEESNNHVFTLDALLAAESLLISFWNEISEVGNKTRGSDQKPASVHLQQAILFTEAASASLLWLIRDCEQAKQLALHDWKIPFKKCTGRGWPGCYLSTGFVARVVRNLATRSHL